MTIKRSSRSDEGERSGHRRPAKRREGRGSEEVEEALAYVG